MLCRFIDGSYGPKYCAKQVQVERPNSAPFQQRGEQ
jgi:hypothetical protein